VTSTCLTYSGFRSIQPIMSPQAVNDPQFAIWDQLSDLSRSCVWEQHIFINGHDKRLGLDARERLLEVTAG
jgi:hypothetical protein